MNILKDEAKCIDSYRPLDLSALNLGKAIPTNIYVEENGHFSILIKRGTVLTKSLLYEFKLQDNLYTLKKELTCKTLSAYIGHDINDIEKNIMYLYQINNRVFANFIDSSDNKLDIFCVKALIENIMNLIKNNDNFLKESIPFFTDEKILSNHSLHVTVYALCFANILGLNRDESLQLGFAALLHDVGKKKVDAELMDKEELSMAELEKVHSHVRYSIEIIKHNDIYDPYVLEAVTHHHERYDGSGYPNALSAKDISQFASILAICDVFDTMTSDTKQQKALSTFEALKSMAKDTKLKEQFNIHYLALFIKAI